MKGFLHFLSYIFFQITSIFSGSYFFSKLKVLNEFQYRNRIDISNKRLDYLKKIVNNAYDNVPFYKEKYKKEKVNPSVLKDLNDLSKFPVVTQDDVKKHYKEMLNTQVEKSSLKVTHSSGSTGAPKTFYYDNKSYGWRLASLYQQWEWAGYSWGKKWMRITLGKRESLFYRLWNFFTRCVYVNLATIDDKRLQEICEIIDREKPEIIYTYTLSIYILSEFLERQNKTIDGVQSIITHGSILLPKYRNTIEKVFNTKVFDTYGGDAIVISGQCEEGSYHICDLGVIVEVVDDKYKILENGKLGRLLVTDLHNYTMPLIRYEIGDLGSLVAKECKCGRHFSLMTSPQGRDTDIIKLTNGVQLIAHYFGILFKHYSSVVDFQVRETSVDCISIYLKVNGKFRDEHKEEIINEITDYCKGGVKIKLKMVDEIPCKMVNKRRYVIGLESER